MSAVCQAVESSLVRALLSLADPGEALVSSFALATHAVDVTVTPTGLLAKYDDAATFALNFYAGDSEEKQTLPKLTVVCSQGQPMEDVPNVHTLPVEICLEASCDSATGFDSVLWMDQASRWLHDLLCADGRLADDMMRAEARLGVSHVSRPEVGRNAEGRRRIHRWQFSVVASLGN